jgi:hypothetical protein
MRELTNKAKAINPQRIVGEVYPWFSWKTPRNKAIQMFRDNELEYLVVNSHSWGCWKTIQLAEDVAKHGIKVRLIGAFDPTAGRVMRVPENVEFVEEIWATWASAPAWARIKSPAGLRGGKYIYPYNTPKNLSKFMTSHIAVGSLDAAHNLILNQIRGLL